MSQPSTKPRIPNFSSGPCAKRPGYDVAQLDLSALGRSHRSALGKKLLGACCTETARILGLPEGYRVAVVPASDTGAVEMAMWSLLGPRGVDMLAWESFGAGWVTDVMKQLKLKDARKLEAGYGDIVGHAQTTLQQRLHGADGDQVAGGEDRIERRAAGQQFGGRVVAGLLGGEGIDLQGGIG